MYILYVYMYICIYYTPKCDAFGNSFFPLLSIIETQTVRASFSHHLVIW